MQDFSNSTPALYYVHNDHLGTPQVMTDNSGQVIWQASYDPFGAATVNGDPDGDGIAVTLNVRFPGQYYDAETGLHYNYFRTYDPETGTYTTSDPIGLAGGLNTYAYVGGNPVRWVDPLGLDWFRPDEHPYMAGREGTIIEPGPIGNGKYIDDYMPAGHTFASIHDKFVGEMTAFGWPDWLVNIPSMPSAYLVALAQETLNSIFKIFSIDSFEHDISDDLADQCP